MLYELMMSLGDLQMLNGESGYYLTMLGAALEVCARPSCSMHTTRVTRLLLGEM